MSVFLEGHTVVYAGHGYGEIGPYLLLNDVQGASQYCYGVVGKRFSMKMLPQRYCVGRFDLLTYEKSVCPLALELLPTDKDDMCPACKEATGFNPSFYNAEVVSLQQRAYNQTKHYVYLAYFSKQHVKAGISSETRGIERLLEQGARAARIVGRLSNADEARALEAALCSQPGILETMRASLKARLLAEEPYRPEEAIQVLKARSQQLAEVPEVAQAGFSLAEEPMDLSAFYFGGPSPDVSTLTLPEGHDGHLGGLCIGMVGDKLVMRQGGFGYVVSLKEWDAHAVELLLDEVTVDYKVNPQQVSLF